MPKKKPALKLRRSFSIGEKVAIAEIVSAGLLLAESNDNKPDERVGSFAALFFECAANIIRGERPARCFSDKEVLEFARKWKVEERATWNPPRRKGARATPAKTSPGRRWTNRPARGGYRRPV